MHVRLDIYQFRFQVRRHLGNDLSVALAWWDSKVSRGRAVVHEVPKFGGFLCKHQPDAGPVRCGLSSRGVVHVEHEVGTLRYELCGVE